MNVSTIGTRNAKIFLKIEGITGKRPDVIFMSDVRAANKIKEVENLFRVTKNGNYATFFNSSRSARGVGIAIRRKISHKVFQVRRDEADENYIFSFKVFIEQSAACACNATSCKYIMNIIFVLYRSQHIKHILL
jgi:hypothetical protein